MIHIFDCHDYSLVNTLDEHAAAVTAVRFSPCGTRLLSCGADRAVFFRCARGVCLLNHSTHSIPLPSYPQCAGPSKGSTPYLPSIANSACPSNGPAPRLVCAVFTLPATLTARSPLPPAGPSLTSRTAHS